MPERIRPANNSQQDALLLASAKFLRAASGIPVSHHEHILSALLLLAARYSEPLWVSRFGSLETLAIEWQETSRAYNFNNHNGPRSESINGEAITFKATFTLTGRDRPLTARWTTDFPPSAPLGTRRKGAPIRAVDAFIPWLVGDQTALAQVATTDSESGIRRAAVEKLTDQAALAQVVTNASDGYVCHTALEKLTDQTLLARIAISDSRRKVRDAVLESRLTIAALERLTDEAALTKVATADSEQWIRDKTKRRLKELNALAR